MNFLKALAAMKTANDNKKPLIISIISIAVMPIIICLIVVSIIVSVMTAVPTAIAYYCETYFDEDIGQGEQLAGGGFGTDSERFIYYMQTDGRWNNHSYGAGTIGLDGCGPTSLAMCVASFSQNSLITPATIGDLAVSRGYCAGKSGSYYSLVPGIAAYYNLTCEGLGKDEEKIRNALAEGKLIVVIMGPGHFTTSGHFIVLRGSKDGKIIVADPCSTKRSNVYWDLETLIAEAKNIGYAGGPFWAIGEERSVGK